MMDLKLILMNNVKILLRKKLNLKDDETHYLMFFTKND